MAEKIREFPKQKKVTPDELPPLLYVHECVSEAEGYSHSIYGVAMSIRQDHNGLYYICLSCGGTILPEMVQEHFDTMLDD